MAFNFGSSTLGPAPAGGGFGFGAASSQQPAGSSAPAPSFSFGGSSTTSTNAPAPSFSFGAAPQPAASTAPAFGGFGGNAPAATTSPSGAPAPSFTFGSTAANTPAPGTFGAPAPGPTTATTAPGGGGGFSFAGSNASTSSFAFGGSSTTPAPPSGGSASTFSLGGSSDTGPAPGTAVANAGKPQGLQIPDFKTIFPNEAMYFDIWQLLAKSASPSEEGREAASELVERLRCDNHNHNTGNGNNSNNKSSLGHILTSPKTLQYTGPDNNLRNQLYSNPSVVLPGDIEAVLLPEMQKEVYAIADDLRISEREALALYADASKDDVRRALEEKLDESIIDQSMSPMYNNKSEGSSPSAGPVVIGANVVKAAKELYFYERQLLLKTVLVLIQSRMEAEGQPWGSLIIVATDSLLQNNLIENLVNHIREWSKIIVRIEQELARGQPTQNNNSYFVFATEKKKVNFDTVHLNYALRERQTAAEILFFIAYHTQWKADEVAVVIDLVRDISNGIEGDDGLRVLNPFHDVPSSYEDPPQVDQPWAPFQSSLAPLKEKSHLKWQNQLVQKACRTSQPDLLRCVSVLVMTVISALDTKQVLMDRDTHRENSVGVGNMLCPSGDLAMSGLESIHRRLTIDGCREWARTDIWGLLCGAYAMLLKASPPLLTSPKAGSSSPSRSLVRTFGDCLSAPSELKSITFTKLSLLPSLQRPSRYPGTKCNSSEFFLAVLSDFVANFLDVLSASGNLPASRASWRTEQEEGLQLARETRQQQINFEMWSGEYQHGVDPIPTSVDMMKRPDCIDDIVALAVAVASLGPEYALKFWAKQVEIDEHGVETMILVPSRANKQLKLMSQEDNSLTAFHYAFLAALSKAGNPSGAKGGADVVNSILTSNIDAGTSWIAVLNVLRWYCRQFDSSKSAPATASNSVSTTSTSYYYRNPSMANNNNQGTAKSDGSSKPMEIGEASTFYLLSLLGLISNVCETSSVARLEILSTRVPIMLGDSSAVIGSDIALNILFSLSTAPLPPEIRGATLSAIASLLCMNDLDNDGKAKMREFSNNAWELVESCQILPIMLLDQYSAQAPGALNRTDSGLRFPASSTSLAGSRTNDSWIPVDQNFSLLYEMEHVESVEGVYPSTEGFLRLLNALFSCSCPSELGQRLRIRSGCTPYIEIVVYYILPRATGSGGNMGKLPFRSKSDEAKLIALALRVVETVLSRYSFPLPTVSSQVQGQAQAKDVYPNSSDALELLGQTGIVEKILIENGSTSTGNGYEDFENKTVRFGQPSNTTEPMAIHHPTQPFQGVSTSSIPAPKSPGFVVLSDLLSVQDSNILKAVSVVLDGTAQAIPAMGIQASDLAETYALFLATPPTTVSAKHAGKHEKIPSSMREQLLKTLRPNFDESLSFSAAVSWREQCIIHSLQVLCAAAIREEGFYRAVNAALNPIRMVPVLRFDRFDKRAGLASQVNVISVHLCRLQESLCASRDVLPSIVEFVGYLGSTEGHDVSIALSALSVLLFIHKVIPRQASMDAICGRSCDGQNKLAVAVARRLLASFDRPGSTVDSQILSIIFDWILQDLRKGESANLALILLGMSGGTGSQHTSLGHRRNPLDCFAALLGVLNKVPFIVGRETSQFAAHCFEIFFRLTDLKSVTDSASFHLVLDCAERLRAVGFWQKKLELFLMRDAEVLQSAKLEGNVPVIHSLAWLLRGAATELELMTGFCPPEANLGGIVGYVPPRIGERKLLKSLLFGTTATGLSIHQVIAHLPINTIIFDGSASVPSQDLIRAAMRNLEGPIEITEGYMVVHEQSLLSRLSTTEKDHGEDYKRWCKSWNMAVRQDCAARHLSNAVRVLIGAALVCFDVENNANRADRLAFLLKTVLERLAEGPSSQFSAMATLDLAWITLLLSQTVAKTAEVTDLREIRNLLARSVLVSGHRLGGAEAVSHQERTAILGASLVEILQVLPIDEEELDGQQFFEIGRILAEISIAAKVSSPGSRRDMTVVAMPTEAAIISRSALVALVNIFDQNIEVSTDSFSLAFLRQTLPSGIYGSGAQAFLHLVARLDEGIILVLEKAVQVPFVGDYLISDGLFGSLSLAAEAYVREEMNLLSLSSQQRGGKVSLRFPPVLAKHLILLRSLLSTAHLLSEQNRSALPKNFFDFLQRYQRSIDRAVEDLSTNGKELCLLLDCVALVYRLSDATSRAIVPKNPLQPAVATVGAVFYGKTIENAVVDICCRIAEQPFPFSAHLPYSLSKTEIAVSFSSVVPMVQSSNGLWWVDDTKESNQRKKDLSKWTENTFQHALLGAEIVDAGLMVVMTLPLKNFIVEIGFVRGFFQLSKAAQLVEDELKLLFDVTSPSAVDIMDTDDSDKDTLSRTIRREYLRRLGRKLSSCVQKLLLALVYRVKQFKQEPENLLTRSVGEYCKAISDALDHLEIESEGIGGSMLGEERDFGILLAATLRELLIIKN